MSKTIELIAAENIPAYTGIPDNTCRITVRDGCEWNGDAYGDKVGRIYADGTVESFFRVDQANNNTDIFDRLRNDIHLITKQRHVINRDTDTLEETSVTEYYIPYKVKNHCSSMPTVTDTYVDRCSNVEYKVAYEILLVADDDFKRYFTIDFETAGSYACTFWDDVKNLEDVFEEWIDEESNGFHRDEYDELCLDFYDGTGEKVNIEIHSINDVLGMISSVRVIKCDRKIINRDNSI